MTYRCAVCGVCDALSVMSLYFVTCLSIVYVFLGDPHALIDFVRSLAERNLNNGEYVVIAVQDETFDPKNSQKYVIA